MDRILEHRQETPSGTGAPNTVAVPTCLRGELRSDQAGETGAVSIYRGVLAVSRDPEVRAFAREHLATEQAHLALMDSLVPRHERSRLLGAWRLAGWLTGALPAMFGPGAVFRTIEAVETFVDRHYAAQTARIAGDPQHAALFDILERCRLDEVAHRDDAGGRVGPPGPVGRLWAGLVGHGSRIGVALASRI